MLMYHKDVYLPGDVSARLPKHPFGLWMSPHARRAQWDDRYGFCEVPFDLDPRSKAVKVIEVKTLDDGTPFEVLYRRKYDSKCDICLVVELDGFTVKTAWLNERDDAHATLDTARYVDD